MKCSVGRLGLFELTTYLVGNLRSCDDGKSGSMFLDLPVWADVTSLQRIAPMQLRKGESKNGKKMRYLLYETRINSSYYYSSLVEQVIFFSSVD